MLIHRLDSSCDHACGSSSLMNVSNIAPQKGQYQWPKSL
jgi:hypothetical protein